MNSNYGIVKYEELCEITTFSKRKFYIKSSNRDKLELALEKQKFVKFGPVTINISSIDTIEPASGETNFIEHELSQCNNDLKIKIKSEITNYKKKHGKGVTHGVLQNMIKKYL